ncbi:hypothetical protein [Streptomyces viridosporus]|uniref:hypothetical protein n=1 Tax=Streptomyces viridosporus TaxID=67581 RepID=UPI001357246F|nr:hypothetical protein [Streptomyces viridosporus]
MRVDGGYRREPSRGRRAGPAREDWKTAHKEIVDLGIVPEHHGDEPPVVEYVCTVD